MALLGSSDSLFENDKSGSTREVICNWSSVLLEPAIMPVRGIRGTTHWLPVTWEVTGTSQCSITPAEQPSLVDMEAWSDPLLSSINDTSRWQPIYADGTKLNLDLRCVETRTWLWTSNATTWPSLLMSLKMVMSVMMWGRRLSPLSQIHMAHLGGPAILVHATNQEGDEKSTTLDIPGTMPETISIATLMYAVTSSRPVIDISSLLILPQDGRRNSERRRWAIDGSI